MDYTIFIHGKPRDRAILTSFVGDAAAAAQAVVNMCPSAEEGSMLLVHQRAESDAWRRPDAVFEVRNGKAVEPPTVYCVDVSNILRAVKVVGPLFPESNSEALRVWGIERPVVKQQEWREFAQASNLYDHEEEALEAVIDRASRDIDQAHRRLQELERSRPWEEEDEPEPGEIVPKPRAVGMRP